MMQKNLYSPGHLIPSLMGPSVGPDLHLITHHWALDMSLSYVRWLKYKMCKGKRFLKLQDYSLSLI